MSEKEEVRKVEIERDPKTGQIKRCTVPPDTSEKALMGMLFVVLDSLYTSVDKFSVSSTRYSRALLFLTAALIVVAIIQAIVLCRTL